VGEEICNIRLPARSNGYGTRTEPGEENIKNTGLEGKKGAPLKAIGGRKKEFEKPVREQQPEGKILMLDGKTKVFVEPTDA